MISLQIEGGEKLKAALGDVRIRWVPEALAAALFQEAEAVMAESKREVPVDMGTLRNSGFVDEPTIMHGEVEVTMGYGGSASAYALWVHEGIGPAVGRPAFMPPVAPFTEWARRVLGKPELGFVIARAVGRRGLRPRKFLENPLMRRSSTMAARLAQRVRAGVERGG